MGSVIAWAVNPVRKDGPMKVSSIVYETAWTVLVKAATAARRVAYPIMFIEECSPQRVSGSTTE